MRYSVESIEEYLNVIPHERKDEISKVRAVLQKELPKELEEVLLYDMITYVVPFQIYPSGYHVKKGVPLPFLSIGVQKHMISLYHYGMYQNKEVYDWFVKEYHKLFDKQPNMGKSCIRLKQITQKDLTLIADLAKKITINEFIRAYEEIHFKRRG